MRRSRSGLIAFVAAAALSSAAGAAQRDEQPWTAHQAGMLLDRSFADQESCMQALTDARRREGAVEEGHRIRYRQLFAHGRCQRYEGHYAIRMHWHEPPVVRRDRERTLARAADAGSALNGQPAARR